MTVGERIRAVRISKGKTQKEVGDAAGMADSAIRKYESGTQTPKIETLQRIAAALGVSSTYLLGYETEREIIPGRLKIIEVNDPESMDIRFVIDATDKEAYEYGLKIFQNADVSITLQERLSAAFEALNATGQQVAVERVEELTKVPDYQKTEKPSPDTAK